MINSRKSTTLVDTIIDNFFTNVPEIQTIGWSQAVYVSSPKLILTPVVGSFDTIIDIEKRCGNKSLVEYMEFWSDTYNEPQRKAWMSDADFKKFYRSYDTRCAILGSKQRLTDIKVALHALNRQLGSSSTKLLKSLYGFNSSILVTRDKIRVDKTVTV